MPIERSPAFLLAVRIGVVRLDAEAALEFLLVGELDALDLALAVDWRADRVGLEPVVADIEEVLLIGPEAHFFSFSEQGWHSWTGCALMRVFVSVVSQKGFARAAKALDTSPANLTRYVDELEAHLGTRLLNRSPSKLSLTEAGEVLDARGKAILDEITEAEAIASNSSKPRGKLDRTLRSASASATSRRCGPRSWRGIRT